MDSLGQQAAVVGAAHGLAATCSAIDAITASDVKSVARKLAGQKVSVGAVGNLAHVPRVNQLN